MTRSDFMDDLKRCELCEHKCGVNRLMQRCVGIAKDSGLESVYWSGRPNIPERGNHGVTTVTLPFGNSPIPVETKGSGQTGEKFE